MLTLTSESSLRILSYPGLAFLSSLPAHVAGCQAAALDPRGRYGHSSCALPQQSDDFFGNAGISRPAGTTP